MRPLYSNKAENHNSHRPGVERRSKAILKRVRRLWWDLRDDIGLFLWLVVGLMLSVLAWGAFIGFEGLFR